MGGSDQGEAKPAPHQQQQLGQGGLDEAAKQAVRDAVARDAAAREAAAREAAQQEAAAREASAREAAQRAAEEEEAKRKRAVAEAWSAYKADDGSVYYYNAVTGDSSWEKPEGFEGDADKASANPVPVSSGTCGLLLSVYQEVMCRVDAQRGEVMCCIQKPVGWKLGWLALRSGLCAKFGRQA